MGVRPRLDRWPRGIIPVAVDTAFAVLLATTTCIAGSQFRYPSYRSFDTAAWVLSFAVALPLSVRRRFAMTALVLSSVGYTVYLAAGYEPSLNWFAAPLSLYTVVAQRPRRVAAAGAIIAAWVVFYSGWQAPGLPLSVVFAQPVLVVAVAWLFGNNARVLRERNEQLAALTAQLHREQQDRAQRAVAEERLRIARELHDDVAHHMSVISVQVGLAQYVFASDPPTARTALDTIAGASRQAQEEMRHLLAALRIGSQPTEDHAPAPGLGRLDELVDRVRAAGLPVEVTVTGEPRQLPSHLDLCVYRIIQEGLTNVLKHAGPAQASVTLEYRSGHVDVCIVDDGRGALPGDGDPAGHGLIGMRERARLFGGVLAAGPRPQGGFEVLFTMRDGG